MRSILAGARRRAPGRTAFTLAAATVVAALAALALAAAPAAAQDAYKVIVNPASPVSAVTKAELQAVFLKKSATWSNGVPATPVDLPEDAGTRTAFSREVLGKSTSAVRAYWNMMVFAGRNVPPPQKNTDADVVEYVRTTPGAVGYVAAGSATPGVRVVQVRS